MSADKTEPQTLAAPLPTFPEPVEAWIAAAESADPPIPFVLSRKTATRWQRVATLGPATDRYDVFLASISTHVVEHGPTEWQLSRADTEAVTWISSAAPDDSSDVPVMDFSNPDDIIRASWELTFRAARMMIDTTSIAPRLVNEVASVYREALQTLREVAGSGEAATLAAVQADASSKKLDKVIGVLERLSGGTDGKKLVSGKTAAARLGKDPIQFAGRLLRAAVGEDRAAILAHEVGTKLALVDDWTDLQGLIKSLWSAHDSGELALSKATLDAARVIVKEMNG